MSSSGGSSGIGGGFCHIGNTLATLRNVTITNNAVGYLGGGIYQLGPLNFGNTIVAGNTVSTFIGSGSDGPEIHSGDFNIISAGGNLVGDSAGDSTNTARLIAYHPTDIRDVKPMLGALSNNGGTTPTHALLFGSPAIDAGLNSLAVDPFNETALAFDQRGTGFPRIVDGNRDGIATVDIGAHEQQLVPITLRPRRRTGGRFLGGYE